MTFTSSHALVFALALAAGSAHGIRLSLTGVRKSELVNSGELARRAAVSGGTASLNDSKDLSYLTPM
jgi:hypothetical protein